ncbi:hypothetical protein PISMIDRAFT_682053, partial [Pisolithus microcarpus 441]
MPSNRYYGAGGFPVPFKPKLYRFRTRSVSYPACGNSIKSYAFLRQKRANLVGASHTCTT